MRQIDERRQEPTTAIVARRVAALRKRKGISAQDLAERLASHWPQMDRGIIANLENGRRKSVSIDEVLVLALVLDVAPVHLIVPLADNVTVAVGNLPVPSKDLREWVRGFAPLPVQDSRSYRTEVPDREWESVEQGARRRAPTPEEWRHFADNTGGGIVYTGDEQNRDDDGAH